MSGGQDSEDQAHEIELTPATPAGPRMGLMMGGALALLVVAAVGAYFAASSQDEPTEVAVAADAEAEADAAADVEAESSDDVEDVPTTEDDGEADTAADESMDAVEDAADVAVEYATDAAYGVAFGGPNNVVHTDDGFVAIGWDANGPAISRSADGTEWSSSPITGIPENAGIVGLAQLDDGFVGVIELWPMEDDFEGNYFGPSEPPERMLAHTVDLENWELSELPAIDVEDGGYSYISGIAVSGETIAMLVQVEPAYVDEMQVLFEAGLITEADLENFCGSRFGGPGEPFIFETCDWEAQEEMYMEFEEKMEAAESDEERQALEEEFFANGEPGGTEFLRIEPGDPIYEELMGNYTTEPEMTPPVIVSGTLGGTWTQTPLSMNGYASGVAGTDAGFIALVMDWEAGGAVTVSSTDGVTWTEGTSLGDQMDMQGLATSGNLVVATGTRWSENDAGSVTAWSTTDLGATWTESALNTDLFGSYGMPMGGPAGIAVSIEGATEPYEFMGPESMTAISDGFELEIRFQDDVMILTGPDGSVVHEVPGIVNEQPEGSSIDGVVRFDGEFGTNVTFLDPATGDDLVSFGEDEFEAAYMAVDQQFEQDYVEPPRRSEIWFSVDGLTWELLESFDVDYNNQQGWTALAGVGDDEVLLRTETWVEPPMDLYAFEEEGREPTDKEIEALDAWHAEQGQNVEWRRIPVG